MNSWKISREEEEEPLPSQVSLLVHVLVVFVKFICGDKKQENNYVPPTPRPSSTNWAVGAIFHLCAMWMSAASLRTVLMICSFYWCIIT